MRREKPLDLGGCTPRSQTGSLHPVAEAAISSFDLLQRGAFSNALIESRGRLAELERIRREFFNDGRSLDAIDRETLLQRVLHAKAIVIDVRPRTEYITAHLPHALAIPLEELEKRLVKLPDNKEIVARTIPAGYSGRDFGGNSQCTVCP